MSAYSPDDAARDLLVILDRAPKGAIGGDWHATTLQAGHSSRTGGYRDRQGQHVEEASIRDLDIIDDVIERLAEGGGEPFNAVSITWTKARLPFGRGTVAVETRFDAALVPRGPDDPIFEAAATARRRFWTDRGATDVRIVADRGQANGYGQTTWFGPHRRALIVRQPGGTLLATDGLSTPWAGITERENGVECELVFSDWGDGDPSPEAVDLWAGVLIGIGDLVADGYRVRRDVETHGAILFCRLGPECLPMTRMILSLDGRAIDGLPFGSAALLRATPVAEDEVADGDPEEPWAATAARKALRRRGAGSD
ncbi:hypothetical protein [Aureimonas psammosilenae]|uniref:hypothetical protein n=1 Tax=Aureimonas psammosilenae TaxID=2495496 RepID=UPI001260BF69|nr:hypothetical protein [Aureimonas psammosilenae]